ncbi:MAG: sulfopyruvate decarboxylase TPP-binding subunit [Halieaceae bacterium]|jgi:sulfopyruvate decarboxylase TPP-binding subunit
MLQTEEFIAALISDGYSHVCAVPCSFATNLINALINESEIEYVAAASEAVACSVAAGLAMSGARPIVFAQSSGLTNMGSCITSLLKPYDIHFPIIVSWRSYKEGDSEIQHRHLASQLPALVGAYGYNWELLVSNDLTKTLQQLNRCNNEHIILVLEAGTFSEVELAPPYRLDLSQYPSRCEFLAFLNQRFAGSEYCFVGTTGHTAREMYTVMPQTKNFYMAGNMGGALSVGYGTYLAGNKTIICGGDAESVMHLGGMITSQLCQNPSASLLYILFDNESNKSTGGQYSYNQNIDYPALARSCGFSTPPPTITTLDGLSREIEKFGDTSTPQFLHVKCGYDDTTARPSANAIADSKNIFSLTGCPPQSPTAKDSR